MNSSSQQIAEALARKCAIEQHKINCNFEPHDSYECKRFIKERFDLILQSIPLVELLECRLALLMIKESCSDTTGYVSCVLESKEIASAALTKIDIKLKQLGVIE